MRKQNRRSRRNRLRRNAEGGASGVIERLVVPALVGAGGILLTSWLTSNVTQRLLPTMDPKMLLLLTGAAGGAVAVTMGGGVGMSDEISQALATGMGIAAITPFLPSVVQTAPSSTTMTSSPTLVPNTMSGLSDPLVDVSHYGAPYQGMLGLGSLPQPPGVSTIIPRDLAFRAKNEAQIKRVTTPFAAADHGYAGGVFARQLFSGMIG